MNQVQVSQSGKGTLLRKFAQKYGVDQNQVMSILGATAFKQRDGSAPTREQMAALLIVADQYNLNPFTKEIYAFQDKKGGIMPMVSIDGWLRIINEHKAFDGFGIFLYSENIVDTEDGKPCPEWIEVTIHRKDRSHPTIIREHLDEVYRPPFVGYNKNGEPYKIDGPWQTHTKRFLRHRGIIQCGRVAFGFSGLYHESDIEPEEAIDITPMEKPQIVAPGTVIYPDNEDLAAMEKQPEPEQPASAPESPQEPEFVPCDSETKARIEAACDEMHLDWRKEIRPYTISGKAYWKDLPMDKAQWMAGAMEEKIRVTNEAAENDFQPVENEPTEPPDKLPVVLGEIERRMGELGIDPENALSFRLGHNDISKITLPGAREWLAELNDDGKPPVELVWAKYIEFMQWCVDKIEDGEKKAAELATEDGVRTQEQLARWVQLVSNDPDFEARLLR